MSDVENPPSSLEDIGAGLLNGAMVTLLGGAVVGLVAWQAVAHLSGALPDLTVMAIALSHADYQAMATDERRSLIQDGLGGLALVIMSFGAIGFGFRLIRTNLALLRARRR